ncbi:RidA family protein [Ottowia sp.]|uniref:RidA family protein n=1 Tax=Ottowia sp. TaxID=1898956 RepID=UPI0026028B9E|nr:RidA family protein [Ottowia sp.]
MTARSTATSAAASLGIVPFNAAEAPAPEGGYAQAVQIDSVRQLLFVSGQIPVTADGQVPERFEDQAALVWQHVLAQLRAAGLGAEHLVKVTTFLASREHADANGAARRQALGAHQPALTVIITGIWDPRWLLEIEAVAAA